MHRSEDGFVLMIVACLLFISVGLVLTILDCASNYGRIAQEQATMEQAMYVAEGGLERGARFMQSNVVAIVNSSTGATNGSGSIGAGTYNFFIQRVNSSTYTIVSTGQVYGAYQTSSVCRVVSLQDIYQPTYAQFALWTHISNNLAYEPGEVFNGAVHADDVMTFSNVGGGPVFSNVVSTLTNVVSNGSSNTWSATNGIYFGGGFFINDYQGTMADVDFNSAASTSLKNEASSQGLLLTGTSSITFNGTKVAITTKSGASTTNYSYTFNSTNGIIYTQSTNSNPGILYLNGGTLTGRLTLVSDTNMLIQGNITYSTNPEVTNSTDALALIARDNIIINTNAPNNLQLQAAILSPGGVSNIVSGVTNFLDGSFSVLDYNTRAASSNLNVYGCIVQNDRGAVNTFNSSTGKLLTGYSKNYKYDPRFINSPPPYFPTISSQVIFSQWRDGH
jgi:hypothetical protein